MGVAAMVRGGGKGVVVVIGVKFDAESRELLTWLLMKVIPLALMLCGSG